MMKLRSLLFVGFAACVASLASCDGSENANRDASIQVAIDPPDEEPNRHPKRSRAPLTKILARADAAFAEMEMKGQQAERFESHIGPQPWPDDLPSDWPTPTQARVVAVTIQDQGNRLLLVDLPESAHESLIFYRDALRAGGYQVATAKTQKSAYALHAINGDDEAVLTFFDRKHATRLEILLIGHGS